MPKDEIFIEFVVQGNAVKATAIDAATGIEASIMGPANAAREALADAALRKLKYVLQKKPRLKRSVHGRVPPPDNKRPSS